MTRKSKREIERALEGLGGDDGPDTWDYVVVHEDDETGQWYDGIGEDADPVDEEDIEGADQLIVFRNEVIETGWSEE